MSALDIPGTDSEKEPFLPGIPLRERKATWKASRCAWILLLGLNAFYLASRVWPSNTSRCSPTTRICWAPCGPNIDCSQLIVPLDYTNLSSPSISLSLARYRATAPSLGSLIIEPGGPGGSGTQMVWNSGAKISRVVEGRYDIIGFDPRGINNSEPKIECWATEEERAVFHRAILKLPSDAKSSLAEVDAWYEVWAKGCSERSGEAIKHVSTAFVARDVDQLREALGQEKLMYWDACEYPVDGRSAIMWGKTSLDDTVHAFEAFLDTCASVGPSRCPLVKVEGTTAVDLRLEVEGLLMDLSHRPLPVTQGEHRGIVTRFGALSYLYSSLYRPNAEWPRLAEVLDALITQRNGSLLLQELAWENGLPPHDEEGTAVLCSDAVPANMISLEEWASQTREMVEKSFISGEFRSLYTLPCRTWLGRPKERYVGNFSQKLAHPILLIGGTHDPATPLRNARRLAHDMGDSARLIVHHGFGHTSTRHVSNCTTQAVRDLLLKGILPEAAETHCFPSKELFPVGNEFDVADVEEREILRAMRDIGMSVAARW
ncbi:hypothetical protein DACRYDRAFT_118445 [Dacryopinax primogenitus]|uniref:Alpha/beta-hydrolase n=1 Tax=Dacryopinax primogenitus (strain DJM 731) TaxID=1858805 RepID=M5FPJ9_DACPD|nr:uncharacterized protein DACRYDRAFT_118445 [Dacryopinax primogenitus]EJT98620.1 hypothetical protein DACRYDRAFT_118445 [Dacryopinax primogenitus]